MENLVPVRRIAARHAEFNTLVVVHRQSLWSYILKLIRDHHLADDLCQEVYIRAYEMFDSLLDKSRVRSWLFSIGYHVVIDWIRRKKTEKRLIRNLGRLKPSDATWCSPLGAALRREEIRLADRGVEALWRTVDTLPSHYREVMKMRYEEHNSLRTIASRTGISVGNIKVRLHRARNIVKREMSKAGTFLGPVL